ncbi:hypothetical protein [Allobranchiibius huperziae]|uniref:Heavy metal transporter n=1 Tax=Allobranchiibius huperziae TaxID=1874116 RepID=A0A853DCT4_9MICO|nr:hypothetical protein [Allobranchiibius huperziae]NYJ73809.1 hypothetical protein [Allobranchiibius huperziae]
MPFRKKKDPHAHDREFDGLYDDHLDASHEPDDAHGWDHDVDPHDPVAHFDFHDAPRRRRGCGWTAGCLVPIVLVAAVAGGAYYGYQHLLDNFGSPTCQFTANGSFDYSPEQAANAATIVDVGTMKLGLEPRAAQVAVATSITESKLRNLTYGDRDSLGLFQQRPSQGWGTQAEILDPVQSSTAFYNRLTSIDGWQAQAVEVAAQEVQRSGVPTAYADHVSAGQVLTASLDGGAPEKVTCRLDPAKTSSTPAAVVSKIANQTGLQANAGTSDVTFRARSTDRAWAVAAWAVTHADAEGITSVTVGDREWKRHRGRDGAKWIGASRSAGSATSVRITLAGR